MKRALPGAGCPIPAQWMLCCLVWVVFGLIHPGQVPAADAPGLTLSPDRQFDYAETLFQEQDFRTAEVEFKRFVHFFPEDPRVEEAVFKTGMALFYQKQFREAARHFNDLIRDDPDLSSTFTTKAYFMQSRAFREMDNLGYARVTLQNLLVLTEDPAVRDQAHLDLADLHIHASRQPGTDELDQALAFLEKISADSPFEEQKNERISRIMEVRSVPGKNPVLAGVFAVIPGGGFLYTGRFHDAAAAFVLNTGLGLAAWKAFDQDNPALGGVIALVGSGFYSGSIYGSISAAHKHNHRLKTRILDRPFHLSAAWLSDDPAVLFTLNHPF